MNSPAIHSWVMSTIVIEEGRLRPFGESGCIVILKILTGFGILSGL